MSIREVHVNAQIKFTGPTHPEPMVSIEDEGELIARLIRFGLGNPKGVEVTVRVTARTVVSDANRG